MKPVAVFLLSTLAFVPGVMAGELPGTLPETWYSIAPWAAQPPVDLARRLAAANRAVNAAQGVVTSYSAAVQAQADIRNQRMAMQTELDSYYLAQREAQEQAAAQRRHAELDAAAARTFNPVCVPSCLPQAQSGRMFTPQQAAELGVTTAEMVRTSNGWGNALNSQLLRGVPK